MFEEYIGKECKIVLNPIVEMVNGWTSLGIINAKLISERDGFIELDILETFKVLHHQSNKPFPLKTATIFEENQRILLNINNILSISLAVQE